MMVFVQPMYSKQELNADSNYVTYTSLIRGMLHVRPDIHFIVVFPDAGSGFKYADDGFFRLPNVTRVPQRIAPRKMANAVSYDGFWYDRMFRDVGVDIVWCNLVEIAGHIRMARGAAYNPACLPTVIAAHNYVIHDTLPYPIDSIENVLLAQLNGAILSDVNVFNSDHCQWMLMDNAKKYLSKDMQDRIASKSERIDYGQLDIEKLKPVDTGNEIPIVAYNHRLQGYKQYRKTFQLFEELYKEGVKFRVRFMNNTSENVSTIRHYPFVEVCLCKTHDEYLDKLRECDLNTTNTLHETFCIAAIESMALGQPVVAPDSITFPQITGRAKTKYPYLYKTEAEQKAYVTKLLTDAKERKKWGKVLSKHVRESYNQKLWAERYAALFDKCNASVSNNAAEDTMNFFKKCLEKCDGKTLVELRNTVYSGKVNGRTPLSNQSCSMTRFVRLVDAAGGQVRMRKGTQYVSATR